LEEGRKIIEDRKSLKTRQEKLELSDIEYAVLLTMEKKIGRKKELVYDIKKLYKDIREELYPGWIIRPTAVKKIDRELRSFIRRRMKKYDLSYEEMDNTYKAVRDTVKKYGESYGENI